MSASPLILKPIRPGDRNALVSALAQLALAVASRQLQATRKEAA